MQAKRWKKIAELYQAALAQPPEKRGAFLVEVCPDDAQLRDEVQSLLDQQADCFLESAPLPAIQALRAGAKLGNFEIVELLGRGGMGEVWRARDGRLQRDVAIKVLPAGLARDPDRIARFEREARAAGALNHPNIVSVYDIGCDQETYWIASEVVSGETLRRVIDAGPLRPTKAIEIGIQVAGGLAAAHAAGLVHRDLKPGNIMITRGGQVKILDFGVAKQRHPAPDATTADLTDEGAVLGTAGYMSPEQVRGGPADHRSDLFSVGAVLYEMLCGQRAFSGASSVEVMNAILKEEPPELPASVPPALARIVRRCLEKEPDRRFQDAADLKVALEWLELDLEAGRRGTTTPASAGLARRRSLAVVLMLVAAGMAVAFAVYRFWPSPPHSPQNPVKITSDLGLTLSPALSDDGKMLAYASDRGGDGNLDIWMQQLPKGKPLRRTHDKADELAPHFSPDAQSIVFERTGSGVYVMPALEGEEHLVAPDGLDPRFSPDGTQIAYWVGDPGSDRPSGKVYVMPSGGGTQKQLAADLIEAQSPLWAPDGKHVLVQGRREPKEQPEWWIAPLDGGPARDSGILSALRRQGLSPVPDPGDWKGNHIVFSARAQLSRHLWYATLKPHGWQLAGDAEQLTFSTASESEPSLTPAGQVVFSSYNSVNSLWRLALSAGGAAGSRLEQLPQTVHSDTCPTISADAKTLAFLSRRSGTQEVWMRDLEQDSELQLTISPGGKSAPVLTADGSRVAYSVEENGKPSIYVAPAVGHAAEVTRRVCENCGAPSDWVRDHDAILYSAGQPQSVYLLDIRSGASTPILRHPNCDLDQAHVSPDGHWIAFVVAATGADRSQIFISSFRNGVAAEPNQWIAVTDGGGRDDKPRWQNSDSLIYYSRRDRFDCLWKQRLRADSKQPAGAPFPVCHFHTLRLSPRTLYRAGFEIAVARDRLILNLAELTGNVWQTTLPQRR